MIVELNTREGVTLRLDFDAEKESQLAITLAEEFLDRLIPHPQQPLPTNPRPAADRFADQLELLRGVQGVTVTPNGFSTKK